MIQKLLIYGQGSMISKQSCLLSATGMALKMTIPERLDIKGETVKRPLLCILLIFSLALNTNSQVQIRNLPLPGYEKHIKDFIDSIRIIDTHEHLSDPEILKKSNFLDFFLLLHNYNYNDLISAGLTNSHFEELFNQPLMPKEKWKILEPFWENSFNTGFNRVVLLAANKLYGIEDINESTVDLLSEKIKKAYQTDWVNNIIRDSCRIDYIIQDGDNPLTKINNILFVKRFTSWLTVRTKFRIDSLAVMQLNPIFTLEDFVASMKEAFNVAMNKGIVAVKINLAYSRTLSFEDVGTEVARKIFRKLINGNEDYSLTFEEVKPLQDYMVYRLLDMARENKMPVAFHTGLQSGNGNLIENSNPTLLANIFIKYPDVNFVLFHGSYPFGGQLATLAKSFSNVYIDMNWTYAISPSYSERYLHEWLETIPANKIMAFGGDFRCVENIYGELLIAKQVISNVLTDKVRDGYISEYEAIKIAQMILHDNAMKFYNIR